MIKGPDRLRTWLPGVLLGLCGVLQLAGCGKPPTFNELIGGNSGNKGTDQNTVVTSPPVQPVQPAESKPVEPAKPDPIAVIEQFKKIPSGMHDDSTIGSLFALEEGLELVTEINAASSKVTDDGLRQLYKLPSLVRLELEGTMVSDRGCEAIGKVASLEELSLSGGKISDIGVAHLLNCTQLKRLVIDGTQLTEEGWATVGEFPALEEIWIRQSSLNDVGMDGLCNARTLLKMVMNDTAVTDEGLKSFRKLDQLRSLNLSGCRVTCEGLASVVKGNGLKEMKEMIVQRTPLNEKGAAAIGGMKGLEQLNIAELQGMQDAHFRMIVSGKKNLRYLNLHTNKGLTNNAIGALKGMTELEFVDLSNIPGVNDGCLPAFAKMKKLKTLNYQGTGISQNGVSSLKLPELNQSRLATQRDPS